MGLLPPARGSKSALGCHLGRRAGCRGLWPQADRVGVEVGAEPVSRLTRWPGSERVLGPWAGKVLILDSVNWVGFWEVPIRPPVGSNTG